MYSELGTLEGGGGYGSVLSVMHIVRRWECYARVCSSIEDELLKKTSLAQALLVYRVGEFHVLEKNIS